MIHINIAPLNKHIDELRSWLTVLNHPFDIIGISETRLHTDIPMATLDIERYQSMHTPANTTCGGGGMYVKSCHNSEVIRNLTKSIENVSGSSFIEIKGYKNITVNDRLSPHPRISPLSNKPPLSRGLNRSFTVLKVYLQTPFTRINFHK